MHYYLLYLQTYILAEITRGYTVYVIHVPISVFVALPMLGRQMQLLLKFCLAAVIGLPLCFGIAWLLRKIPYVKKIL